LRNSADGVNIGANNLEQFGGLENDDGNATTFFCLVCGINYAILILWCLLTLLSPAWVKTVTRWFGLTEEKFASLNYAGISFYKLSIILFNLAPYLALRIMA